MTTDNAMAAEFNAIVERILDVGCNGKPNAGAPVVALMSRTDGEGVTTVAIGLARSIGRRGRARVLLVDHDPGLEGAASRLGITGSGLAASTGGDVGKAPEDRVRHIEAVGIDLLTLPGFASDGLAENGGVESGLSKLRPRYDLVLVDAGPSKSPAALRWGRLANQVLLVVDTGRTTIEELEHLKGDLDSSGRLMTGAILNKRRHHVPDFLYRYVR